LDNHIFFTKEKEPLTLSAFIFKEVLSMKQSLFYTDNEALFAILNTKNVKIKASDAVDSSLRFIYNALWYAIPFNDKKAMNNVT
jgi:hypothetical protein